MADPGAGVTARNLTSGNHNVPESLPINLGRHVDHNTVWKFNSKTAAANDEILCSRSLRCHGP
jgi:hypothetical protein